MSPLLPRTGLVSASQPPGMPGPMLSTVDSNSSELLRKVLAAAQEAISRQNPGFGTAVADASYSTVAPAGTQVTFASSVANFYFYINEEKIEPKGVTEEKEIVNLDDALKVFGGKQLEKLNKLLFAPEKQTSAGKRKELALGHFHLHGLPGLGKTQLAIKFANQNLHDFSLIWFIRCNDDELYKEDYRRLATALNIPVNPEDSASIIVERVHLKLQNPPFKKPWLIILDDVVKPIPLPPIRNGIIFSTSRQETLWRQKAVIPFPIQPFNLEETEEFFTKSFTKERLENLKELWTLFKGWPVLLVQAWNYLSDIPDGTLDGYLKELQEIDPMEEHDPSNPYPRSLNQAFEATLQRLKARSTESLNLVYVCAYLNPNLIPLNFINRPGNASWRQKVIHPLEDFSILKLSQDRKNFHIHSLWQDYLQKKLQKEGKELEFFSCAFEMTYREFQSFNFEQFESWEIGKTCTIQIDTMRKRKLWENLERKKRCFLLDHAGDWLLRVNGNANTALGFYSEALTIKVKQPGEASQETIQSYNNVGICLVAVNQPSLAFDILSKAEQLGKTVLKENDLEIGRIHQGLGNYYNCIGEHKTAIECFKKSLEIKKIVLGESHSETIHIYINLGMSYAALARKEHSLIKRYRKGKNKTDSKLDAHISDILRMYNPQDFERLSQLKEKTPLQRFEDFHRKTSSLQKKPDSMPPKEESLSDEFARLQKQSQERNVTIHREILGDQHLWTAYSYENAAACCENPAEALEHLLKALKIKESILDKSDIEIAVTYEKISSKLLKFPARQSESDDYKKRADEIRIKDKKAKTASNSFLDLAYIQPAFRPGSFEAMVQMFNYTHGQIDAVCLILEFRVSELYQFAGVYFRKALDLSVKELRKNHPVIGILYRHIGLIFFQLDMRVFANKYIRTSLQVIKECFGENHLEVMFSYFYLSQHCLKTYEKIQAYQKALEIAKNILGEDHKESVRGKVLFSEFLLNLPKQEMSEKGLVYINEIIQLLEKNYDKLDEQLIRCYILKSQYYRGLNRFEEAFTAIKAVCLLLIQISSSKKHTVEYVLHLLNKDLYGLPEKAAEIPHEILSLAIKRLGEDHDEVVTLKRHLNPLIPKKKYSLNSQRFKEQPPTDLRELFVRIYPPQYRNQMLRFLSLFIQSHYEEGKRRTAELLWLDPQAIISDDMVIKAHCALKYLGEAGYYLKAIEAGGNCFCEAFLESYQDLSKKIPSLEQEKNPVDYLRRTIANRLKQRGDDKRAQIVYQNQEWITVDGEGDLLATELSIPIRIVTVSRDSHGQKIRDMLTFAESDKPRQEWSTIPDSEKPQEYIFIVDLDGHFLYASQYPEIV